MTCGCSNLTVQEWTVLGTYKTNEPVAYSNAIYLWSNVDPGNTIAAPTSETWNGPFSFSEIIMKLFNEKASAR